MAALIVFGSLVSGCERKEKVLDINTPNGGGVEVERNVDTGAVSVDVDKVN